jgi:hypothetical protein
MFRQFCLALDGLQPAGTRQANFLPIFYERKIAAPRQKLRAARLRRAAWQRERRAIHDEDMSPLPELVAVGKTVRPLSAFARHFPDPLPT